MRSVHGNKALVWSTMLMVFLGIAVLIGVILLMYGWQTGIVQTAIARLQSLFPIIK